MRFALWFAAVSGIALFTTVALAHPVPLHTTHSLVIESRGLAAPPPPSGVISTRDATGWTLTGDGKELATGFVPGSVALNLRAAITPAPPGVHLTMDIAVDRRYGPPAANLWAEGGRSPLFVDAYRPSGGADLSGPLFWSVFSTIQHPDPLPGAGPVEGPLPQFDHWPFADGSGVWNLNDVVSRSTIVRTFWSGSTFVVVIEDPPPFITADFNQDGSRGVQDIFDFLGCWVACDLRADVDRDGAILPGDVYAFLTAYLGP